MIIVYGRVEDGCRDFEQRLKRDKFQAAFLKATGERIVNGTLNVKVKKCIPIKEHFRIRGREVDEPEDFLFEICRINGIWAYRIRPLDLCTGVGGHGDNTLEIGCSQLIPNVPAGTEVEVCLLRDDLALTDQL